MLQFSVDGRTISLQMAHHPGLPLLVFGALLFLQSAIVFVGEKLGEGARWSGTVDLILLSLGAMGLGLFEIRGFLFTV